MTSTYKKKKSKEIRHKRQFYTKWIRTFVVGPEVPGWFCSAKGLKSSIPLEALLVAEVTEGS